MSSYEQSFNIVTKILFVYAHQRVQFQFLICQLSVLFFSLPFFSKPLCLLCHFSSSQAFGVVLASVGSAWYYTSSSVSTAHVWGEGWETLTWGHSWGSWGHFGAPPLLARWKLGILGRLWRGFHSSLAPLDTDRNHRNVRHGVHLVLSMLLIDLMTAGLKTWKLCCSGSFLPYFSSFI